MTTPGIERSLAKSLQFGWHRYVTRSVTAEKLDEFAKLVRPWATEKDLIRRGGEGDGGYLLPNDLEGIAAVFSPGVAESASFEQEFLANGVPCHLIDASVDRAPMSDENMTFQPMFLGASSGGKFISLKDWVAELAPKTGDLLLQMDIEGAEFEVLATVDKDVLRRFRIIVVEFHRTHLVFTGNFLRKFNSILGRLHEDFVPVHVHANNARPYVEFAGKTMPRVFEMTLIRRDRVSKLEPVKNLPHPLDETNVPGKPDPGWPDWLVN